ncbi:unannotated protein [freshwater metagenome]|uniref:Unannotated protein n=1 Tax=freshwater metagenome TaxID=449393 RepID=A0A6J7I082_9ZZZZ|nr:hypothetical protein [Actinomycetota bacterium]
MHGIGASLREARMRQQLDITEVEADTKIRGKYLRALENDEWDVLPGPTFVKSFLRTYGDRLGLDGRLLVEEFKVRYERPQVVPIVAAGQRNPREVRKARNGRWIVVAILVLVLIVGLIILGSSSGGGGSSSSTQPGWSVQHHLHA